MHSVSYTRISLYHQLSYKHNNNALRYKTAGISRARVQAHIVSSQRSSFPCAYAVAVVECFMLSFRGLIPDGPPVGEGAGGVRGASFREGSLQGKKV